MYVYRADAEKLFGETIKGLVDELRAKGDLLHSLLDQDDWSFVIKAHALVEAAVTQLVIANIGNESLVDFIQRLSLGGQFGKVRLCEQLSLLSPPQRKFIRWFSELRNPLVHRLEAVSFTFENHVSRFTKEQAQAWVDSIVWFSPDDPKTQRGWKAIALQTPKHALYMGLYLVVGECVISSHHSKAKKAIHESSERTMKSLTPASSSPDSRFINECKKILRAAATANSKPSRKSRSKGIKRKT